MCSMTDETIHKFAKTFPKRLETTKEDGTFEVIEEEVEEELVSDAAPKTTKGKSTLHKYVN